ncbi:helix-turn-helix domain-containing protein [Delftia tsuruhatensis]|uniref:transcriptional regulator n=1 Tax=Delftia tsuruhatensis TaxID=180282 RepID=UPI00244D1BA7|nr:YdaS family helix-turn-helix protein [Delftia tsuruhatensis]MDH0777509.1 helix-turn-helix domain-containing protein [Delftia tsuruhatensis]MDH1824644.1 helix-turn-helix domain-containing protein [Delftia tsuruhatensis]
MTEKNPSAPALREAISMAGSQSALGRLMGHSQVLVHKWLNSPRPLGEKHCVKLEKLLGIPRSRSRPDDWEQIWPELAKRRRAPAQPKEASNV